MFSNGDQIMAKTIRVIRGKQAWVTLPGVVADVATRRSGSICYTIRFDDGSEQFCDEAMIRFTLRPFFSYYGGKWRLAPQYPAPLHRSIVEPFAGSAGYSVRHYARDVTLIDANPKVAGTWAYLIAATPQEIERLPLIEPGQRVDELPVCQEARWLIGWWCAKGSEKPRQTLSAWAREPRWSSYFWGPQVRSRIAEQVTRIRHWKIIHGDYRDHSNVDATWFIDPPYSNAAGRRYPYCRVDFRELAEWSKTRTGQVIVCENDGATWLPFRPFASAQAMHGRGRAGRSAEVVWVCGQAGAR